MKSTPRHLLTSVVIACALVAALAGPSMADSKSDLENRKNGVNGNLNGAKQSYDESSKAYQEAAGVLAASQSQLASAQGYLGEVRGQLVAAQAYDQQMQAQLAQSEADLKTAEANLVQGESDLTASEQEVAEFSVESIQAGDPGLRAFGDLLRGEDPATFTEKMTITSSIAEAQLSKMDTLDAARIMLDLTRAKVQTLRDQVQVERDAAAANLATITTLEAEAAAQEAAVAQLVAVNSDNKAKADQIMREDASQVAALEAERASLEAQLQRLAAEELARQQAAQPKPGGGGGGAPAPPAGGSSLSRPVGGPVTSSYGMRVHPVTGVYKLHDGTDFGSGCGTPIKAAASGTVIQQYYNGAYGNRVIINHGIMRGANVVTTYNHLSRYAVGAGSYVQRGQVIGYVGSTGYSTGCHLHWMVLVNGSTTNPMGWL